MDARKPAVKSIRTRVRLDLLPLFNLTELASTAWSYCGPTYKRRRVIGGTKGRKRTADEMEEGEICSAAQ